MCVDHDPYQTQAPAGRKVYMGTCCQTPVTPLGFKRLLDTVFYTPVAPLGLKSCGYHFFYTPIAPLGLKSCGCFRCYKHIVPTGLKRVSRTRKTTKLTLMVRLGNRTIGVNLAVSNYGRCGFLTAPFCINTSNNAKDENISVRSRAIHAPLFFKCKRRNELRDYKRVLSLN